MPHLVSKYLYNNMSQDSQRISTLIKQLLDYLRTQSAFHCIMSSRNDVAYELDRYLTDIQRSINWDRFQTLEEVISGLNKILDLPLESSELTLASERLKQYIQHFQESFHEPVQNENMILDTVISRSEELFSRVSKYMNDYPKAPESRAFEVFYEKIKSLLLEFYDFFMNCDAFFDVHIDTQALDLIKGLGLIIKSILLEMLDKETFCKAYTIVAKYTHAHFLTNIKLFLNQSDIITSSTLITGCLFKDLLKDWPFFFLHLQPQSLSYYGLDSLDRGNLTSMQELLCHIVMSEPISRVLAINYLGGDLDMLYKQVKLSLERLVIMNLQPSMTGLTTYNKLICITWFGDFDILLKRAATAIIFLHEFCHFLNRISCQTMREVKKKYTPKKPLTSSNNPPRIIEYSITGEKIMNTKKGICSLSPEDKQINKLLEGEESNNCDRGESGFDFEQEVFGVSERVSSINMHASDFLLSFKNYPRDIGEFRQQFTKENSRPGCPSMGLARGGGFSGVFCNFSKNRSC